MARKKKPKVVLKRGRVVALAAAMVAVCACMLAVAVLTAPKAQDEAPPMAAVASAGHESPPQGQDSRMDEGVATVIARIEEAERRAKEAERKASEAEKRAQDAERRASDKEKDAQAHRAAALAAEKALASGLVAGNRGGASSFRTEAKAPSRTGSQAAVPSPSAPKDSTAGAAKGRDYAIPPAQKGATLVFIFDDGGQSLSDLQHYLDLPFPVDVAVLPRLSHSVESARRVRASGRHELLLHQPMQARNLSVDPGPGAITPAMGTTEIDALVRENLAQVGPVAGMNNHEGSLVTESKIQVGKVIEICQKQGIFFLDSRTSANTAAPQAALELGARIWERDVFLDNTQSRPDILGQIQRGLDVANKKGYAIMIGHVWSAGNLAQILQELYPVLKSQGYSFSTVGGLYENFGN